MKHDFERGLDQALDGLSHTARTELNRRGAAVQRKVLSEFNWKIQGERLARFIEENVAQGG